MARLARLVVPGFPHHVTQRGGRRQHTFFCESDFDAYLGLLGACSREMDVAIWAYCLMPNHVHLVAVPVADDSLAKLFRCLHQIYARQVNFREGWRGHLWQERFHSSCMDESHLLAAVRYIELNPVRAGLCARPDQWPWSSVHGHMGQRIDPVLSSTPALPAAGQWPGYLAAEDTEIKLENLRRYTRTGRPAGDTAFVRRLEALSGRSLQRGRPGPKKRESKSGDSSFNPGLPRTHGEGTSNARDK